MKTLWVATALAALAGSALGQTTPPPNIDQLLQPAPGPSAAQGVIAAVLDGNGKPQRLTPEPGTINSVYAFVTVLFYADFNGVHASIQTDSARPTLYVKMGGNPEGRIFLVRAKANDNTHNRSMKIGKAKFASYAGIRIPDPDWCVPYTAKQVSPGEWAITPNVDMKPGEYGLFVPLGTNVEGAMNVSPGGELYGFEVSGAPSVAAGMP